MVSDGSTKPFRMHWRGASFVNLQSMPTMMRGAMMADAIAIISSIDPVLGEVDR
jgi:NADH-quinone oxidoreductase subunit D